MKGGCSSKTASNQYEWLVRQTLRLTRHDGTHVYSRSPARKLSAGLLRAALRLGGDQDDHDIAALVLAGAKTTVANRISDAALPDPATHSEWAAVAILRPQWSRGGQRLTVLYPGRSVHTELSCGSELLWSGPWEFDVRVNGQSTEPTSDWESLCWCSDDDADFLELEIRLTGNTCLQRHMMLARRQGFLLMADAVLNDRPATIDYTGRLPLCRHVDFRPAEETREGMLVGKKRRATVLPLALPEWRADHRSGQLAHTAAGLQLCLSNRGPRLYAPLFFDLDRRRHKCPLTWRQLTVAQSLKAQPPEVAVGYRVGIGNQQWLIYRSLAEKANRTLLGHNLSTEMLVARFDKSGEVKPLVEIE
jgi:hypothetical protein